MYVYEEAQRLKLRPKHNQTQVQIPALHLLSELPQFHHP